MSNILDFPLINPLKMFLQQNLHSTPAFTVQVQAFNPSYNQTPFDADFYTNRLRDWEDTKRYFQPYQKGDKICLQWQSETTAIAADFSVYLIDCKGNEIKGALTPTVQTVSGFNFFTIQIPLWDVAEGIYFVQIRHFGAVASFFISEPIEIKEIHENTVLIEYFNSYNAHSVFFEQSGIKFQLRVHGKVDEMAPNSKRETYEDQPLSTVLLSARPFREWQLTVGILDNRITEWMADKVSRSFDCDSVRIDYEYYTAANGATLEPSRIEGHPLGSWTLALRDRYNKDSLAVTDLGYYNLSVIPKTKYFYVNIFRFLDGGVPTNITLTKYFSGARNFVDFLNTTTIFEDNGFFINQGGYFAVNEKGQLIFVYGAQSEKTLWLLGVPTLEGILPYWVSAVFRVQVPANDILYISTDVGNGIHYHGDGTDSGYGVTGVATYTYANPGTYNVIYFYDVQTQLEIRSVNGGCIESIGGQFSPLLEKYSTKNEILRVVENDFFTFAIGAFDELDLSSNNLPVSQINKIIVMLHYALTNKRISSAGAVDLSLQSPLAPPSGLSSIRSLLSYLNSFWTITTD